MGKGGRSSGADMAQRQEQPPADILALPQFEPFLQPDFNPAEFTSRVLAASRTTAQAQAEELQQGVRQLEQALSSHVLSNHPELLQHVRRLADTEHSLQDVVLSVSSLQASVKRIRAEIDGPYTQARLKTRQLKNIHTTIEVLRHLTHRLKLTHKLKQQLAAAPALLDLAKAAKLLTDILAISREADMTGIAAAEADAEFLKSAATQIQDQAQVMQPGSQVRCRKSQTKQQETRISSNSDLPDSWTATGLWDWHCLAQKALNESWMVYVQQGRGRMQHVESQLFP